MLLAVYVRVTNPTQPPKQDSRPTVESLREERKAAARRLARLRRAQAEVLDQY